MCVYEMLEAYAQSCKDVVDDEIIWQKFSIVLQRKTDGSFMADTNKVDADETEVATGTDALVCKEVTACGDADLNIINRRKILMFPEPNNLGYKRVRLCENRKMQALLSRYLS